MFENNLSVWQFVEKHLKRDQTIMLLTVVESIGSSPGRQGFKMAINTEGVLLGSIGGGIMEQKLVELAKVRLLNYAPSPFLKKQIHRKDAPNAQSGMICSGEQTVLFYPLQSKDLKVVKKIIRCLKNNIPSLFHLSPTLFSVIEKPKNKANDVFEKTENDWYYAENLGLKKQVFIIGGGHCSLALSDLLSKMDFYIHLFDDRQSLNTFENNHFAHEKHIIDYTQIADFIPNNENIYIVIMTLGYRSDEQIIRLLLRKNTSFKYMGVLGSQAKADTLKQNLLSEGFSEKQIVSLNMPIGLKIKSQTPMEIAVSIAAEIISLKP